MGYITGYTPAPTADVNLNNPLIGYHNLVTVGNVTAGTTATGYPATNAANPATHLEWRAADTTEQVFTIDLTGNTLTDVQYIGIAKHNLGSAAIAVSVEGKIGAGAYATIVAETTPANDAPILFRFTPAQYSGLRVRTKTGTSAARWAVIFCGQLLALQRRIYVGHTPLPYGRQFNAVTGQSESGNFLGRIITGSTLSTNVPMQNITPDWYRTYLDPFVLAGQGRPFFFAWRPTDYPLEVGYAWLTNQPVPSNQLSNGLMQITLAMNAIVS